MNRCKNTNDTQHHKSLAEPTAFAAWSQRALRAAAVLGLGLGVALGAFAAPLPYNGPTTAGDSAAPYSWPTYHAGGFANLPDTTTAVQPNGLPYPLPPYNQLLGTPSGIENVPATVNGINTYVPASVPIYSSILGNYNAGSPPGGVAGTAGNYFVPYWPNHFHDGPVTLGARNYFPIDGPLGYVPSQVANPSGTAGENDDVQGSPVAINATEYPEIEQMFYTGQNTATNNTVYGAPGIAYGTPPGAATVTTTGPSAIRQVVYFTRKETLPVIQNPNGQLTVGGVPISNGTNTAGLAVGTPVTVSAIYAMNGFTGDIIWRYQPPAFTFTSSASSANANYIGGTVNGQIGSANGNGPQPFEIGTPPTNGGVKGVTPPTPFGVFLIKSGTGGLGTNPNLQFSLQATTASNNGDGTVTYTGDFQIYNTVGATGNSANSPLSSGTFSVLANFNTPPPNGLPGLSAIVTGTLTPTTGVTAYGPLSFNGEYTSTGPGVGQQLSGNVNTILQGAQFVSPMVNSVSVARVNVIPPGGTTPTPRLMVVAADNNGFVYCLDAVGNGPRDTLAASNTNVVYQNTAPAGPNYTANAANVGQIDFDYQPTYAGYTQNGQPHVGTTYPYWIYRPDQNHPLQGPVGLNSPTNPVPQPGMPDTTSGTDHVLPVPQAFNLASPTIYVDRNGNGAILIGNSNGVLYALDSLGGVQATAANEGTGLADAYNLSLTGLPGISDATPTTNVRWWDAISQEAANTANNTQSIQSAPALYTPANPTSLVEAPAPAVLNQPARQTADPLCYVATSYPTDQGSSGRVYAVDVVTGPFGNGQTASNNVGSNTPGTPRYNDNPQGIWRFPQTQDLGSITGSPVVFSIPPNGAPLVYFAADTGNETVNEGTTTATNTPSLDTGRVWAVNALTGIYDWVYPGVASGTGNPDSGTANVYNAPMEGFNYATPAVGMVQYPATIQYLDGNGNVQPWVHTDSVMGTHTFNGGSAGPVVPMLYVGTYVASGSSSTGYMYYIDLDGTDDTTRSIARYAPRIGVGFTGSPALVVNPTNPTATAGNGGSLFFTVNSGLGSQSGYMYQYEATPTSTANPSLPSPEPAKDYRFTLGGPVSSPSVAAASVADLTAGTTSTETVTDWVYVGDSASGLCYGFTPRGNGTTDFTGGYLGGLVPNLPPSQNPPAPQDTLPLRGFLYDGSTAHPANSTDMNQAFGYGKTTSQLPVFEWGQNVYIRIANVVPPEPPSASDPTSQIVDPEDPNYYLGSGSAITINTATTNNAGQATTTSVLPLTIPATILPNGTDPSQQNGFFLRSDTGTTQANFGTSSELLGDAGSAYRAPSTVVLDSETTPHGWAAGAVYSVGVNTPLDPFGGNPGRRNTPGSGRQLLGVHQTATLYTKNPDGTFSAVPNAPPVQLNLTATPNFTYAKTESGVAGSAGITIDQPTFGILNPLAVRAAGVNVSATTPSAGPTWNDGNGDGVGPFRGINTAASATLSPTDLEALANGNRCPKNAPPSGVLTISNLGSPPQSATNGAGQLQAEADAIQWYTRRVITTTGQIPDGTSGDNSDPNPPSIQPSTGSATNADASGLAAPADYGQYLLDIADRSMLATPQTPGATASQLRISMQRKVMFWRDHTGEGGPGACINPLPWEAPPPSVDYQNLQRNDLTFSLNGNEVNNTPLTGATEPAANNPLDRVIYPDSVQALIAVPRYQSANLQLWSNNGLGTGGTPIPPALHGSYTENFPDGYSTTVRVAGAANGNPNPLDLSQPFRDVTVMTGVPVDIKTSISNPTTDIGVVPHGFGVQASSLIPVGGTQAIGPFTPYNQYAGYAGHWQPLTILNDGNVNLINPHLDQVFNLAGDPPALPLLSDATNSSLLDPYSFIPAYDFLGLTGPRTSVLPNTNIPELPFLVRSSLDTDLGEAYGRSPLLTGFYTAQAANYPTVTFHKPLVGDGEGTTMTVPDVPHGSVVVPSTTSYASIGIAHLPLVSVAVPLGTPVGTYAQNLRLFEGYDIKSGSLPYDPLIGPTYDGQRGGFAPFDPAGSDANNLNNNPLEIYDSPLLPYSDPGTQIKVTVGEDRLTNAYTPGALPMIDVTPRGVQVNGTSLPTTNFAPSAFRDPKSSNLNLFWTTAAGTSPPVYNIAAANLAFTGTPTGGYFTPAASKTQWWTPNSGLSLPAGNNVGWNVALNQVALSNGAGYAPDTAATTGYGFAVNIGTTTPYLSSIGCVPITTQNGSPTGASIAVTAPSTQPKSDVHGLKFTLSNGFADPNGGSAIMSDLWAFWTGGTRGRTALYYSPAQSNSGTLRFGTDLAGNDPVGKPAVLPIPAGLTAVSDPNPVITNAPNITNSSGTAIPAIEVTYTGVGADGNADLYLSRYQPYHPRLANGSADSSTVLLGLMPFPSQDEQLAPASTNLSANGWWQARDVGWVRSPNSAVNPASLLQFQITVENAGKQAQTTIAETGPSTFNGSYTANGNTQKFTGRITLDQASGILVFNGAILPFANANTIVPEPGQSVFVDMAGGRLRFSLRLPVPYSPTNPNGAYSIVQAIFNATARRITTSPAADTEPVAFLDQAYEPNASGVTGSNGDPNVQADRYWYLWRKTAIGKTGPTLWYKTQRLTVALTNPGTGLPTGIEVSATGQPQVTVTLNPSGAVLYKPGGGTSNVIDVDARRGRLYFPIVYSNTAMEGQNVNVTFTPPPTAPGQTVQQLQLTNQEIAWMDEPQANDTSSQTTTGTLGEAAEDGYQVPMNTVVNESGVSAFLDPLAYLNTASNTPSSYNPANPPSGSNVPPLPHNVWLFWTSTRNGAPDLYYETINPRFTASNSAGVP